MTSINSSKARQERSVKQGRGRGHGDGYRSHILITRNEMASRGRSAYTPSLIVNRHHDELSHLESKINLFLPLLRPIDVREGYRLELHGVEEEFCDEYPLARGTVEIASALGYRHPKVEDGGPFIMSTDFLVTEANHQMFAVNGKYEREFEEPRTRELTLIEQLYWRDRNCRHYVATEKNFSRIVVNNLEVFASFSRRRVLARPDSWFISLSHIARTKPIGQALQAIDTEPLPTLIDTLKHALATGRVTTDLAAGPLRWNAIWPPISVGALPTPPFAQITF